VIGAGLGAILTSIEVAVSVTGIVLLIGVPAAFALSRKITPRWNRIITVILGSLLVLQMVPQPMTVIPLYSVLANWKLLGTLPGLILRGYRPAVAVLGDAVAAVRPLHPHRFV